MDKDKYGLPNHTKEIGNASFILGCIALSSLLVWIFIEGLHILVALSVLGLCGLAGMICGIVALGRKYKSPLTIAGLILSILSLAIPVLALIFGMFSLIFGIATVLSGLK